MKHNVFEGFYPHELFENFEYLTNKSRGKHVTEARLWKAINNGTLLDLIKNYDSILYHTMMRDYEKHLTTQQDQEICHNCSY